MTQAIDDVGALPDRKVHDQEMREIGKITHVYAIDGDGEPAWVSVRASFGLFNKQDIIIPLARLKEESGELVVPYSLEHIQGTPTPEDGEIDEAMDRKLRDHFAIDAADQELRSDHQGYATLVPDKPGPSKRVEDPTSLETPNADKRSDETYERLKDPGSAAARDVDAGEIANELATNQANSGEGETGESGEEGGEDTRERRPAQEPAAADGERERSGG